MGSVSVPSLQRALKIDCAVVEALRLHPCECDREAPERSTADVEQFIPICTNQGIRTGSGRCNERTQQPRQDCIVGAPTQ